MSSWEIDWAAWMRAAMAGDADAYRQFLMSVTPHVRAIARSRCRRLGAPEGEAEDVVQEVLLAIHLKRGTWDQARPIGPWIAAITRNKVGGCVTASRPTHHRAHRRRNRHLHGGGPAPGPDASRYRHPAWVSEGPTEGDRSIHIAQRRKHPRNRATTADDGGRGSRGFASCTEDIGSPLSEQRP